MSAGMDSDSLPMLLTYKQSNASGLLEVLAGFLPDTHYPPPRLITIGLGLTSREHVQPRTRTVIPIEF